MELASLREWSPHGSPVTVVHQFVVAPPTAVAAAAAAAAAAAGIAAVVADEAVVVTAPGLVEESCTTLESSRGAGVLVGLHIDIADSVGEGAVGRRHVVVVVVYRPDMPISP